MFIDSKYYQAKSAGTHRLAKTRVSQRLIDQADAIFVMSETEDGHPTFLKNNFDLRGKNVCDLEISDVYDRGEPELIKLILLKLSDFLPKETLPER